MTHGTHDPNGYDLASWIVREITPPDEAELTNEAGLTIYELYARKLSRLFEQVPFALAREPESGLYTAHAQLYVNDGKLERFTAERIKEVRESR